MTVADEAITFAKQHKVEISRRLTDPARYPPSAYPVTVFMAGSPGAGKTEYSKNLLAELAKHPQHHPVRIDSDELRSEIPSYTGNNSAEMQGAVSILLRELYERTLKNNQTVIVDGTFSNYEKAKENVTRSLHREREVFIFYLYQRPEIAWQFTLAREKVEGRHIPKDVFIHQFIQAKETVNQIRKDFQEHVNIFLVKKDFQTNQVASVNRMRPEDPGLDAYLQETYTKEQLLALL
ncbi:zeta toxin family protein [Candidatus Uhrbacteria bacterium]|nr:zeta toxin family protein [Candidatus Uhrbacteria bacterium]